MNDKLLCSLIMLLSVFVASISQIGLKKSALKKYPSTFKEYLNGWVVGSYCLFFASTLLTVLALKGISISFSNTIESSGYIFVSIFSFLFLKEKMSTKKIIGMIFIVVGILVYTIEFKV